MIVNLTQHPASADQRAAGVIDVAGVIPLLTFDALPSARASCIVSYARRRLSLSPAARRAG